jgi:thioesterase domain-containing protein
MTESSDVSFARRIGAFFGPLCTPTTLSTSLQQRVTGDEESLPPYLTVLQSGDPSLVYALIAPGGGSCASYVDLAQHLSTSATIVALEHPIFASHSSPQQESEFKMKKYSVVNLGDLYARDLQHTFGGMKECVVIGASFGGVVGVEVSRCLVRGGIAVKSLNLLDSPWPALSESLEGALKPRALVSNLFGNSVGNSFSSSDLVCANAEPDDISMSLISTISAALSEASPVEREAVEKYNWKALVPVYVENVYVLRDFSFPADIGLDVPAVYIRAILSEASSGLDHWKIALPQLVVHEVDADHASFYSGRYAEMVGAVILDNVV